MLYDKFEQRCEKKINYHPEKEIKLKTKIYFNYYMENMHFMQ